MIFHQIVYRFGISPYSNGIYEKYELSTTDILDILIALVALYHIMQLYSYIFQDKIFFFLFLSSFPRFLLPNDFCSGTKWNCTNDRKTSSVEGVWATVIVNLVEKNSNKNNYIKQKTSIILSNQIIKTQSFVKP